MSKENISTPKGIIESNELSFIEQTDRLLLSFLNAYLEEKSTADCLIQYRGWFLKLYDSKRKLDAEFDKIDWSNFKML